MRRVSTCRRVVSSEVHTLELTSGSQRCAHLPPKADEGPLLDARDSVLATVRDIEDLVMEGKRVGVCPYYATRKATKQAQLVTLPYNLLLQKNAREALGIDLTGQIVVVDEAHSKLTVLGKADSDLIDTILSIYSATLPSSYLTSALSQLTQYLSRFRSRLKPRHALMISQVLSVLRGLVKLCTTFAASAGKGKAKSEMMDVNELMTRLGGSADAVNLIKLVAYLQESKLARKVSGYAESLEESEKKEKRSSAVRHASIAAFHSVESLLLSLTDSRDDGRVILSQDGNVVIIKYVLLNPAERFAEVVSSARSVILAGGTMEPVSSIPEMKLTPALRLLHPALPLHPKGSVCDALLRPRHSQVQPPHSSRCPWTEEGGPRIHIQQ